MEYIFSAGNQALWAAGKLIQATTNTGQLLPILRDPITGKFVEVANLENYFCQFRKVRKKQTLPI